MVSQSKLLPSWRERSSCSYHYRCSEIHMMRSHQIGWSTNSHPKGWWHIILCMSHNPRSPCTSQKNRTGFWDYISSKLRLHCQQQNKQYAEDRLRSAEIIMETKTNNMIQDFSIYIYIYTPTLFFDHKTFQHLKKWHSTLPRARAWCIYFISITNANSTVHPLDQFLMHLITRSKGYRTQVEEFLGSPRLVPQGEKSCARCGNKWVGSYKTLFM